MIASPRILPLGDAAATVELGHTLDLATSRRVRALDRALAERPFPGLQEAVPAYASLLVLFDRDVASLASVRQAVLEVLDAPPAPEPPGALRRVPTVYGGEHGPDLGEVARSCGLSEEEVIALHTGSEYIAFMLGFLPGFAYLGTVPPVLETTRRSSPRPRVPSGSVAIAGRQTAVYPSSSPGGWNLIGRTSCRLFEATATPPALIQPGDRVRFERTYDWSPPAAPASAAQPSVVSLEVLEGGLLTTVQDGGRGGHRRLGVPGAGPMDTAAHRAANRAVGNPPDTAALECTLSGPTLRFHRPVAFSLAGADLGAVLERADLGAWPVPLGRRVVARPGNVLSFTGRRGGCRVYMAPEGGLDVPIVLGSRSTDLTGGFGGMDGRALKAGDLLGVVAAPLQGPREEGSYGLPRDETALVRIVLGPQDDLFPRDAVAGLLEETYRVGPLSDRVGCRLSGAALDRRGGAESLTRGMVPGSIQVPPDGQPIVMMADSPTTGGYRQIACVIREDLAALAQLVPGEGRVRFRAVTLPGVP